MLYKINQEQAIIKHGEQLFELFLVQTKDVRLHPLGTMMTTV